MEGAQNACLYIWHTRKAIEARFTPRQDDEVRNEEDGNSEGGATGRTRSQDGHRYTSPGRRGTVPLCHESNPPENISATPASTAVSAHIEEENAENGGEAARDLVKKCDD